MGGLRPGYRGGGPEPLRRRRVPSRVATLPAFWAGVTMPPFPMSHQEAKHDRKQQQACLALPVVCPCLSLALLLLLLALYRASGSERSEEAL